MKASRIFLAVLALAGLLGSIAIAHSRLAQPGTAPTTKADHIIPPAQQPRTLEYLGNVIANEGGSDQQKVAANLLRTASVPPSRTAHFNSVLSDPRLQLTGWSLEILDISTTNGVAAVKVRVIPLMVGQQSVTVIGAIDETYELGDHAVQYIKSETPSPSVGVILD